MEEKIPSGFVEIEIEIDEDGSFTRKILRHGEGDSCKTQKDDDLLNDIFADLGEVEDYGRTPEYYEKTTCTIQKSTNKTNETNKNQENKDLNTH
jgi:hypothetical protein